MTSDLNQSSQTSFEAVLFDFGGIFIDSPFEAVIGAAEGMNIPAETLTDLVFGSYDLDTDHPWHRLERGEITFDHARSEIISLSAQSGWGEVDPIAVLMRLSSGGLEIRSEVVDTVIAIRSAGMKTAIVTNNLREFSSSWRAMLDIDSLFDVVVDSSEVGMRKPDPRIFLHACELLGVKPSRSLFVDDHHGNVAGANRAGLVALDFGYTKESAAAALAELRHMVGIPATT